MPLDNKYVDLFNKYGVLIDLKIIILTIFNVFTMKNIYEKKDESMAGKSDEEIATYANEVVLNKARSK